MLGEAIKCDECGKVEISEQGVMFRHLKDWQAEGWWFVGNPHNRVQHYCSSKCVSNATWEQAVKDSKR